MRSVIPALGAALVLALTSTAGAEGLDLEQRVEKRLARAGLATQGIEVSVSGDTVHLTGVTTSYEAKRAAEKAALQESDDVRSELRVFAEERKDSDIRHDVEKAILRYVHYSVFDAVGATVHDGAVVLQGSVRFEGRKHDIEDRVARVAGIRDLQNEIAVQPPSLYDDRLRLQLVRAIYGDGSFAHYGGVNPPIRILVSRGHITLAGTVGSEVERSMAGFAARNLLAFGVDNQIRLRGEAPPEDTPKPSAPELEI